MNTKTRHFSVAALGCASLLASCAPSMNTARVPMSAAQISADNSLAGEVYASVNEYRGSVGRAPLPRNTGLDKLAQRHSEFLMANRGKFGLEGGSNVSHYGFEERALYAQRAMNMQSVAENVASGPWTGKTGARQMVKAWSDSSGHNLNMKGEWSSTGVGVAVDKDGTVFSTQIFATKNNSLMTMTDRLKQF